MTKNKRFLASRCEDATGAKRQAFRGARQRESRAAKAALVSAAQGGQNCSKRKKHERRWLGDRCICTAGQASSRTGGHCAAEVGAPQVVVVLAAEGLAPDDVIGGVDVAVVFEIAGHYVDERRVLGRGKTKNASDAVVVLVVQ